jgi:hypothetical protein
MTSFNSDKIILLDSYAYEEPNEESDLDLLIIKDIAIEKHKRVKMLILSFDRSNEIRRKD